MLSEEAVLGFEYGYSLAEPNALVLWEAQFGDFANGAQVIIDQFISSGERKWLRMSGLVLLLPHGYEGQGPEHSSARLERYLQLCAEDNWQIANCTTPANYFHVLRRQLHRQFRKPLVLMTPKSLLRHKRVVSTLAQFGPGTSFHRVLWDDAQFLEGQSIKLKPDAEIKRVVLCSGKVYYDLYDEREKRGLDDVYLLRMEQLYPFPARALIQELSRFNEAEMVWCQEEPKNMGAWSFIEPNLSWVLDHIEAKHQAAALCRAPGVGRDGDGVDEQASAGTEDISRRGFGLDHARKSKGTTAMATEIRVPVLGRIDHRGDGRPMVQAGRRQRHRRRAAGRARDRQGDGRGAGAGVRRAVGDHGQDRRYRCRGRAARRHQRGRRRGKACTSQGRDRGATAAPATTGPAACTCPGQAT